MGEKINELPASSDIVGDEQFPMDQDPAGGTDYETVRVTIQKAVWQYTKEITSDYTLADGYARVSCDATSGAIALTIASAQIALDGKPIMVIKTDSSANAVTIGTEGSETINGAATYALSSQWQAVLLIPDGTNVLAWVFFMDSERTKLAGIEAGATADQTGAEIKAAYEAESDTNAYTDAAKAKVDYLTVTEATDLDTIRTRVDALDAAVVLIGSWDASGGSFPGSGAAQAGWSYIVTVAGTVDGVAFSVNDRLVAIADNASTSTYADNWLHLDYSDLVASVAGLTGAIAAADLRTALDFANQARAAIGGALDAAGKLAQDLDCDGKNITNAGSVIVGGKYPVLAASNAVLRRIYLEILDGTDANTISVRSLDRYQGDTTSTEDNLAKSGSTTSFALNSGGNQVTFDSSALTGNCLSVISAEIFYNTTTVAMVANGRMENNDIVISLTNAATGAVTDLTSLVDTGDLYTHITYLTTE